MSRPHALRAAMLAAVLTLPVGCATTSRSTTNLVPAPASGTTVAVDQDHAYIHQVEQIARRRGIGVTWVNPPIKRRVVTR